MRFMYHTAYAGPAYFVQVIINEQMCNWTCNDGKILFINIDPENLYLDTSLELIDQELTILRRKYKFAVMAAKCSAANN